MLPGGFTVFMFIPKECEAPPNSSYKEHLEVLKESWGQYMGEDTKQNLSRMDMFLPKNVDHLDPSQDCDVDAGGSHCHRDGCGVKPLRAAWRFVRQNSPHIARLISIDKIMYTQTQ